MIPVRYRAGVAFLLRHPWQLLLSLLGIAIGVAVIIAVDLATSSARTSFLLSMDTLTGQATHQVIGGPAGLPEEVYTRLRVTGGFVSGAPIVEGTVKVGDSQVTLLGVDLFAEATFRGFTVESSAAAPDVALFRDFLLQPGAVSVASNTASDFDLQIGDSFSVIAAGNVQVATLVSTFGSATGVDHVLVTDIATAQEWLGKAGVLTRIDVRVENAAELDALKALLPDQARVLNAASRTRATLEMSSAFMTNLLAMSLLALLVGIFLIFNSVNFSVLQRRRLFAVLRALGLTRRELLTLVLAEAALLGAVGAAAGVLLGVYLGDALLELVARTINDLYFRVNATSVSVESGSILKGVAAGVGASLLAALLPALEAASFAPRLAMTRSTLEHRAHRALPAVTLTGIGMLVASLLLIQASGESLVAGLTAVFMLILGIALCVPWLVRLIAIRAAGLAARIGGTPARMAVAGIAHGLSRTGIAVVALAIAVSATVGVSVMVDSFRGSVADWLGQTLQADLYLTSAEGPIDAALVDDIRGISAVSAVSTLRGVLLENDDRRIQLRAIDMPEVAYQGTELLDADANNVWPAFDHADAVLVSEPFGYHAGVGAGDSLELPTDRGMVSFAVAATFQSFDVNASAVMMHRRTYDHYFTDSAIDSLGLYLDDESAIDSVSAEIAALSADRQELRISSNADIRALSLGVFDRTFVITDVLYWLALAVAIVGILSAMLALQLERSRELATLRALGMTPGQVRTTVLAQTATIGLLSGLAAIPLGSAMAYLLVKVINRRAFGWEIDLDIAPGILLTAIGFSIIAALLAGLYPAYRAGRIQPAAGMREE